MKRRMLPRRLAANAAIAAAAAALSVAGVSLAQGDPASATKPAASPSAPPAGILAGVDAAMARLLAGGMIDQTAADAVDGEARAGSIDPKLLVSSGVVSDSQMRVIAAAIDAVKQAGG